MLSALTYSAPSAPALPPLTDPAALLASWHAWLDAAVRAEDLSAATASTYRNGMQRFMAWLEASPVTRVGADDIRAWRGALIDAGNKPASVNTWLAGVRSFYGWAVEAGSLAHNPTAGMKGAKRKAAGRHRRDALTAEEARSLLALPLPARDAALIRLMLYTGARSVEVQRARFEDIRTIEGELVLLVRGKGDASDEASPLVLAHPAMQRALMAWLAERGDAPGPLFVSASDRNVGGAMSLSAIRTIVREALNRAGIVREGVTTHSLRHTAITAVLKRTNGNIRAAQTFARHASVDTTLIYAHELRRIADAPERVIDYGEGEPDPREA